MAQMVELMMACHARFMLAATRSNKSSPFKRFGMIWVPNIQSPSMGARPGALLNTRLANILDLT